MVVNDRGKLIGDFGQFQLLVEPQMFTQGYLPAGVSLSRIHTVDQSLNYTILFFSCCNIFISFPFFSTFTTLDLDNVFCLVLRYCWRIFDKEQNVLVVLLVSQLLLQRKRYELYTKAWHHAFHTYISVPENHSNQCFNGLRPCKQQVLKSSVSLSWSVRQITSHWTINSDLAVLAMFTRLCYTCFALPSPFLFPKRDPDFSLVHR